jgi:fucose permease
LVSLLVACQVQYKSSAIESDEQIGWVVEYLVDVRHGKLSKVGYTPAGLYGGIFLDRLLLAEPTHRFGERRMILLYSVVMLALQVIFWLVPNIIASATALSLLGFFFGPLFPIVSHFHHFLLVESSSL